MRLLLFMIMTASSWFLSSCNDIGTSINKLELSATVQLTDTSGRETTTFRPGENFDIHFTLTNTTNNRLTFPRSDSGPDVRFNVFRGDSLIASSVDGYAFLMRPSVGYLEPSQTLQGYWRAPNTPAQYPRVLLTSGSYELRFRFPGFDQVAVADVPPTQFLIIE